MNGGHIGVGRGGDGRVGEAFFAKFKQPRVSRDEAAVMVVCACVWGGPSGGWLGERVAGL